MLTSGRPGTDGKARCLLAKVSPWGGWPTRHSLLTIVKVGGYRPERQSTVRKSLNGMIGPGGVDLFRALRQ